MNYFSYIRKPVLFVIILLFSSFVYTQEQASSNSYTTRLDFGINLHDGRLYQDILGEIPSYDAIETGQYLGFAIHKNISPSSLIGTRIDIQRLYSNTALSVRAIDFHYLLNDTFSVNGFIGASRYHVNTPAYGYSIGFGLYYRIENIENWGFSLEGQYFDNLARDNIHPDDPDIPNDSFYYFRAISFGINYYF